MSAPFEKEMTDVWGDSIKVVGNDAGVALDVDSKFSVLGSGGARILAQTLLDAADVVDGLTTNEDVEAQWAANYAATPPVLQKMSGKGRAEVQEALFARSEK